MAEIFLEFAAIQNFSTLMSALIIITSTRVKHFRVNARHLLVERRLMIEIEVFNHIFLCCYFNSFNVIHS
jgi:hypothetical protein